MDKHVKQAHGCNDVEVEYVQSKSNEKFQCDVCIDVFDNAVTLSSHKQSDHQIPNANVEQEKTDVVGDGNQSYPQNSNDKIDKAKDIVAKEEVNNQKTILKEINGIKCADEIYKCNSCLFETTDKVELSLHTDLCKEPKDHVLSHESNKNSEVNLNHKRTADTTRKEEVIIENISCSECDFECENKETAGEHMQIKHRKGNFECDKCNYNTYLKFEKDRHIGLFCQTCGLCLPERVSFDIHMALHSICVSQKCKFVSKTTEELGTHTKKTHRQNTSQFEKTKCESEVCLQCNSKFETMLDLEWHTETEHEEPNLVTHKCQKCTFVGNYLGELELHIITKHAFLCNICKEVFSFDSKLSLHMASSHQEDQSEVPLFCEAPPRTSTPVQNYTCERCEQSFPDDNTFSKHICSPQTKVSTATCDQCDFKSNNLNEFVSHIRELHRKNTSTYKCGFCELEFNDKKTLDLHIAEYHEMLSILTGLARNQIYVSQSFDEFKEELKKSMQKLFEDHNAMNQELFILRQLQQENKKEKTNEKADIPQAAKQNVSPQSSENNHDRPVNSKKPFIPEPKCAETTKTRAKPSTPTQKPLPKSSTESKTNKILMIGDSISGNVDLDALESAMKGEIKVSKAYSAIYDVGNEGKSAARYPSKNFKDVIPAELSKDSFEYLILQAGAVDITNLNTKDEPEKYLEYFKQEVVMSAQHLFSSAVNALQTHPTLKKVIIMNLTPRTTVAAADPLSLKPALVLLFNNTLRGAWMECSLKERLVIGAHNLECSGGVHEARYRDIKTGKYDGVHLYGPSGRKAFSVSVLNILKNAGIVNGAVSGQQFYSNIVQFRYQQRKQTYKAGDNFEESRTYGDATNDKDIRKQKHEAQYQQVYSVPTYNRFANLNC